MEWCKYAVVAVVGIGMTAGSAFAQLSSNASKVITFRNDGPGAHQAVSEPVEYYPKYRLSDPTLKTSRLTQRRIVDSSSLVSNGVAKQPTWPGFAEVRQGSVTVFVDPNKTLQGQRAYENNVSGIDENHSIRRAQRLYNALNNMPRVVVYRNEGPVAQKARPTYMKPKAIIHIPMPEKFRKEQKKRDNYVELDLKVVKADKR